MNQSIKLIALFLVFASLATMALGIIPRASATTPSTVPYTGNMLIKIYLDPSQEEAALQTGDIDINDWPLSSTFITSNAANSAITLNNYAEIGEYEFDINNQLWPTGPNPLIGGTRANPVGPGLGFFNATNHRDLAALHFRRAIALLSNRAKYTTDFMGGYGYVMQTAIPVPAMQSYTDYTTLTNSTAVSHRDLPAGISNNGFIYTYNRQAAIIEFRFGGFIIPQGQTARQWFEQSGILVGTQPANGTTIVVEPQGSPGDVLWNRNMFAVGNTIQIDEPIYGTITPVTRTLTSARFVDAFTLGLEPTPGDDFYWILDFATPIPVLAAGTPVATGTPEPLPNMKLWARLDDPNRRQAGQDLYNEMIATGIPAASAPGQPGLDLHIAERSTEFAAVMVSYDYNIYTGGWSLTADPDGIIYDLFHSSMGQYGYANNYAGFQNKEYDPFAQGVKFAPDIPTATYNAIQAQWIFAEYVGTIPLWAAKGVKGYRTGWQNVVNYAGLGTDNGLSFTVMNFTGGAGTSRNGPANTIVYGFKSDISALQVMTSEWVWDWNVLNQIYDTLISRNPYNLAQEMGDLATSWNTSVTWPGWAGKTVAWFTLRDSTTPGGGAYFHNGDPVTPADVAYSILAVKAAGAGNAWNFPTVFQVDHVQIVGQQIGVFFSVQSAWALHWAGFMPIINENLWNQAGAIGPGSASGYNGFITKPGSGTFTPGTYTAAGNIRNFHPWEVNDAAGHLFLTDDGSWSYSFVSYSVGNNVALKAFTTANGFSHSMYTECICPWVIGFCPWIDCFTGAFHGIGNVNYPGGYGAGQGWYSAIDNAVSIIDLSFVANSLTVSKTTLPWGPGAGQYNPDADFFNTGTVNIVDLVQAGSHFGQKAG